MTEIKRRHDFDVSVFQAVRGEVLAKTNSISQQSVMHFDEDAVQRHLDIWHWLLEKFCGVNVLESSQLILPTSDFFPTQPTRDHAFALKTFDTIKEMMVMSDWPSYLEQFQDDRADHPARRHMFEGEWSSSGPAGLYVNTDEGVVISYSSTQLEKPASLIATLVHELCHYMLRMAARSHPSGGWQDHELHTDAACGFMGFGIFACNAVFDFKQWEDSSQTGWSWSLQGYLSESEHTYSLALYCTLSGTDVRDAAPHLKGNPREYFEMALDDIAHRLADIERLVGVQCLPDTLPPILSIESEADAPVESLPVEVAVFTRADVDALGP